MKRGTVRLKPKSDKRKHQDRIDRRALDEFASLFIFAGPWSPFDGAGLLKDLGCACWICRDNPATEIHHMFGRSSKYRNLRGNLFAACPRCHSEVLPGMATSSQLAIKQIRDPDGYSMETARMLQAQKNGRKL